MKRFEKAGYVAITPGWPDDPDTVSGAKAHPEVFAGKSIGEVADHVSDVINRIWTEQAIRTQTVATAISGWSFAAVGRTVTTLEPERSSNHASSGAAGGCHSAPPTRASVPLTIFAPGYPVSP